jgi:hypothetical protein
MALQQFREVMQTDKDSLGLLKNDLAGCMVEDRNMMRGLNSAAVDGHNPNRTKNL